MTTIQLVLRVARRSGLRLAVGACGVLPMALATTPAASAQGFGPDPFRPYNSQFDSAVYPIAPGPMSSFGLPGANRNTGVRGANQFENYLDSLQEGRTAGRRYDQAFRAYDRQFGRQYQPNRTADAGLEKRQAEVSDIYFRYLRETNPQKRAELLQQYKQARARATRGLTTGGRNARGARATRPQAGAQARDEAPELDERSQLDNGPAGAAARSPASRRPAARRPATGGDIPAAPPARSTDAPPTGRSPSEVLDRATRPDIPPAPALPRSGGPRGGSPPPAPPPTR